MVFYSTNILKCSKIVANNVETLLQKLEAEAAKYGLQILEQLTIPIDCLNELEVEKTEVSVVLTVKGDWFPTNPDDRKWQKVYKKMEEVHLYTFYICKNI